MKKPVFYIVFYVLLGLITSANAFGQLIADFTPRDLSGANIVTEGCSPLILTFEDNSTINGMPVAPRRTPTDPFNSHSWGFDDSPPLTVAGSSFSLNPVYAFFNPGIYDVTLIVTDDNNSFDTVVVTITVFEDPIINMTAIGDTIGCDPFTVSFVDLSSSPGDNIVSCLWDFGNGDTSSSANPTSTFASFPGVSNCFSIVLIKANSKGCTASRRFDDYICIALAPVAEFNSTDTVLCDSPFTIQFFDSSISSNNLTYLWDFGDGSTPSIEQNPIHTYPDSIKSYTVKLIVTDTACSNVDSITKVDFISRFELSADFNANETMICAGQPIAFSDSSIGAVSYWWNFGDGDTSILTNPTHIYNTAGIFNVTLVATNSAGCSETTIQNNLVTVFPQPTADFFSDSTISCGAPFTVFFMDASSNDADSWLWDFSGGFSTSQNAAFTYQNPGNYTVGLTVTNSSGCSDTISKPNFIRIEPTIVTFTVDSSEGCVPLTVTFTDNSTTTVGTFSAWTWDFGDNTPLDFNQNPTHVYTVPGIYTATLIAETSTGCIGTDQAEIKIGTPGVPNFTPDSFAVCVDEPLTFTNLTNTGGDPDIIFEWDFNGSGSVDFTGFTPPPNAYDQPGIYCVTLSVGFNQCFADTCIEIEVFEPRADFDFDQNCIDPASVQFNDLSSGATSWLWDFGDMSQPSTDQNPVHIYAQSGIYVVKLIVENDTTNCISEKEQEVTISVTQPSFIATTTQPYCIGDTVCFQSTSVGLNLSFEWDFGDGSALVVGASPCHEYTSVGNYDVSLIVTENSGCSFTETKTNFIIMSSVTANFTSSITQECLPKTPGSSINVNYTDNSISSTGSITRYSWIFEGANPSTSDIASPVNINYSTPGVFDVILIVTNDLGCVDSMIRPEYMAINQPQAKFNLEFNLYCADDDVPFINTSTGQEPMSYSWDFGDGHTGTGRNPTHVYDSVDVFTVKLIITDGFGCIDSITISDAVTTGIPVSGIVPTDTLINCPPLLSCFEYFTTLDTIQIASITWDFGDGSGSPLLSPCHIYTKAGLFRVTVTVAFENFCVEFLESDFFINVGGATGDIAIDPDTGCSPLNVCMNANSVGAENRFWLFGNGEFSVGEDTICYTYTNAGTYRPSVFLTDNQSPPCTWELFSDVEVLVDTVFGAFASDADTVCRSTPICFTDSSSSLIDTNYSNWTWLWDFGDGTFDSVPNPCHVYDSIGLMTVEMTVINTFGCGATITLDVFVRDRPTAGFTTDATQGCDVLLVTFTDTSIAGVNSPIDTFFWEFGDTTIITDTSFDSGTTTYLYNRADRYLPILIVTDINGCKDTASSRIDIFQSPVGIVNADTLTLCLGDTVQLLGDSGFVSYDWTPGIGLADSTIYNPFASPIISTCYTLFTEEANGCDVLDTVCINVVPLPPLTVAPFPDTLICFGDTITLRATGGDIYLWSPPGIGNPRDRDQLVSPDETTIYNVTNTDTITGCQNHDTLEVNVNVFSPLVAAETQCLGQPTDFLDFSTSTRPIVNRIWEFNDPNNPGNDSLHTLTTMVRYQYNDSGNYNVKLTLTDAIGCQDTVVVSTRIDFPATAFAQFDTTICAGQSAMITGGGGDTLFWTADLDLGNPFFGNMVVVTPDFTTNYTAWVSNGVCPFDSSNITIVVIPEIPVSTIEDATIPRGTSIELTTFSEGYDTVYWLPPTGLSCADCLSPRASPLSNIEYIVTAMDNNGCSNADTVRLFLSDDCTEDLLFVANAFTPNGDTKNDFVYARVNGIEEFRYLRVFDRWGKLMFSTVDENIGWDGRDQGGKQLNSGVYVYVAEVACFSGKTIVKKGNITLIK